MKGLIARTLPFIMLAALAGCGKEAPPSAVTNSPGASTTGAINTGELDAVTKANKPYKLALIIKTKNNPFFTPMILAAQKEAAALGATLDVQAPPQETDSDRQYQIVTDVAARGVDAILVAPANSKSIVPALKAAASKGIAVINLDNRVDSATAAQAGLQLGGYVGANNEDGGKLAGAALAGVVQPGAPVAVVEGIRGADNAEARKRGFEQGAKGLKIVAREAADWDQKKAYDCTQSILAAHPEVTGIFCANDKMALGALTAIKEAGKTGKVAVVGYDNIPDVKAALASHALNATIEQHPDLMGKYGVLMAVGILNGSIPKGRECLVPLQVIRPQ